MNIIPSLLSWYHVHKRAFPWRTHFYSDHQLWAYHTWICEVMSQQTLISVVIPKFNQFISHLPHLSDLAHCPEDLLRQLWSGLGYYARARNLKKGAQFILSEWDGRFPVTQSEWLKVPGCGEYTSAIISSICFSQPVPAIDGNVIRVVSRLLGLKSDVWGKAGQQKIAQFMNSLMAEYFTQSKMAEINSEPLHPHSPGQANQAFMDLGSTVCKKQNPLCSQCPLQIYCVAYQQKIVELCPPIKPRKVAQLEDVHVLMFNDTSENKFLIIERARGFLAKTIGFPLLAKENRALIEKIRSFNSSHLLHVKLLPRTFKHSITHHNITGYVTLIEGDKRQVEDCFATLSLPILKNEWVEAAELKKHLSSSLDLKALQLLQ